MEAKVYNQTGKEISSIKLPENVFGLPWNEALVHQVVFSMMANKRQPSAHTKNRGEVSGTGKKPWKQKGTGRARHGSTRSPIWVGGGVAHGPRNERDYSRKINKSMKTKALFTVMSKKLVDGEIIFLENISIDTPKTSKAKEILNSISKIKGFGGISKKNNAAFLAMGKTDMNVIKSFNNFSNLEIGKSSDLNPVDVLGYKYLIIENPETSLASISARMK